MSDDSSELEGFGYKQELERTLGGFSSFAAGYSLISVLTGIFQLFAFGFAFGGPAVWWTWPVVFAGQLAVALVFAELAGQYPLTGSVYQWSKRVTSPATSWMSGWIILWGTMINVAAVAVGWQVVLPQVSKAFEFIGGPSDAGSYITPDGAKNAIILGLILVCLTTIVNIAGVRLMARINNFGVMAELIGVTLLSILLLFHVHRSPAIIVHSLGTGHGHSWGTVGALLIGGIMSVYVMYGFDVAATLAEETNDPRRKAPPAIIRALCAAAFSGGLLILVALLAVKNIHDQNISVLGLPYIIKQALGSTLGNIFLIDAAVAIGVCALALHTAAIRMMFSMARDGALPFGRQIAKVSGRGKTPILPALIVGAVAAIFLVINLGNKSAFVALTSVSAVMFYVAYLCVTGPLLLRRLRGQWPGPNHGDYFSLGRWGVLVNAIAVGYGAIVALDVAWPRKDVYNAVGRVHWYFEGAAFVFTGIVVIVGALYYWTVQARRTPEVIAEHRVVVDLPEPQLGEVAP
jgi:urea carboxylase system permease